MTKRGVSINQKENYKTSDKYFEQVDKMSEDDFLVLRDAVQRKRNKEGYLEFENSEEVDKTLEWSKKEILRVLQENNNDLPPPPTEIHQVL